MLSLPYSKVNLDRISPATNYAISNIACREPSGSTEGGWLVLIPARLG